MASHPRTAAGLVLGTPKHLHTAALDPAAAINPVYPHLVQGQVELTQPRLASDEHLIDEYQDSSHYEEEEEYTDEHYHHDDDGQHYDDDGQHYHHDDDQQDYHDQQADDEYAARYHESHAHDPAAVVVQNPHQVHVDLCICFSVLLNGNTVTHRIPVEADDHPGHAIAAYLASLPAEEASQLRELVLRDPGLSHLFQNYDARASVREASMLEAPDTPAAPAAAPTGPAVELHKPPFWKRYLMRWRGAKNAARPPRTAFRSIVTFSIGAFLGILVPALVHFILFKEKWNSPTDMLLIPPFGASAILLFSAPSAPLSQPRNFVLGHCVSALCGVLVHVILGDHAVEIQCPISVAAAIFFMHTFEVMHPPGGATALVPVLSAAAGKLGFRFILEPVFTGTLVILTTALVYNNTTRNSYPQYWW